MGFGNESDAFEYPSAFDLYLGDVDFENYGDLAENEEHTIENRKEHLEELIMDYEHDEDHGCEEDDHYYGNDDDDIGDCLHNGCRKANMAYSAYCRYHFELYHK